MVSSKESFTSLDLSGGPNIHMGDDSHIQTVRRGSIKIKHGEFQNVLYVPSLIENILYVYHIALTGSPNKVVFGPDSVEISDIATRKIIEKGVANHASKEYEFSHFFPYSSPAQPQQPFERGGLKSQVHIHLHTMICCLRFQFQKMRNNINMILILRLYLKMIQI